MSTAPLHPIALLALLRVAHNTQTVSSWSHAHSQQIASLLHAHHSPHTPSNDQSPPGDEEDTTEELRRLARITALSEPKDGGPLGVINWTGPSVWTDAVLTYLKAKYGVDWTDLRGLRRPVRVGDTVILPVTGFSPGVGNFGAGTVHGECQISDFSD